MKEAQISALKEQLNPDLIATRDGAWGKPMSYIAQQTAVRHANRIFGEFGWHRETVEMIHLGTEKVKDKNGNEKMKCAYRAKVRITVGDVVREGTGYGDSIMTGIEVHELACKEAESDAMKRALMTFGAQFGLDLYDKDGGKKYYDAMLDKMVDKKPEYVHGHTEVNE